MLSCHPQIQLPPKVYFKPGCLEVALRDLKGKQVRQAPPPPAACYQVQRQGAECRPCHAFLHAPMCPYTAARPHRAHTPPRQRAFIVTDRFLYESGMCDKVTRVLDDIHVQHRVSGSSARPHLWQPSAPYGAAPTALLANFLRARLAPPPSPGTNQTPTAAPPPRRSPACRRTRRSPPSATAWTR